MNTYILGNQNQSGQEWGKQIVMSINLLLWQESLRRTGEALSCVNKEPQQHVETF